MEQKKDSPVVHLSTTASFATPIDGSCSSRSTPLLAQRVASTNCTLLITGATGTGKGHIARWIYQHSARAEKPFVPVNCGAIPESLIDSHLFGHAKGAFSGAASEHPGLVRAASGGTLLLDEISELPLTAQTRLLRLLEEREVQPVGYSKPITVDVRIIAATNRDLQDAVRRGMFREDLYFRLDVVRLHLKPLRERSEEIPHLMAEFNAEFAALYGRRPFTFTREAMSVLKRHPWPGNVRELRTVVERLHVLCGSTADPISIDDLRLYGQMQELAPSAPTRPALRVQELRKETISEAMSACRGNVSRVAASLGVHRSTIYRWMADQTAVSV